jgi:hypothetical protein
MNSRPTIVKAHPIQRRTVGSVLVEISRRAGLEIESIDEVVDIDAADWFAAVQSAFASARSRALGAA